MADRTPSHRTRLLRVSAVRALEDALRARDPEANLMERAGAAVARVALRMAAERAQPILFVVGPGNNGGDALVAARVLHERGIGVRVALLDDPARLRGDAADAWARWQRCGEPVVDPDDAADAAIGAAIDHASLVVDGLFGIGFARAPTGRARAWIERINASGRPVLAIDVPSGVDADTGHVADIAIVADRTITFVANKPGLATGDALDHVGDVVVDPLGADDATIDGLGLDVAQLGTINGPSSFDALRRPRRRNSHKGSYGSVAVVGGDHGMVGAALMASRMALHAGAGRVYVKLIADDAPGYDVVQPELMLRDTLDGVDATAVAIGPGLGHGDEAMRLLARWIVDAPALCVDADGLNAIAKRADLGDLLRARTVPAVLTPHPLEAARLLGCDAKDVQRDRLAAAAKLASRFASVVVLKGAGTIVCEPGGAWVVNATGNPALATGGTGDVLTGLVAGLLAQHLPPADAARAAVWLHGHAADTLVASGTGPVGLAATELIPAIRAAINALRAG